ncbi:MAG: (Fe-S)-binding protein [Thermodesulfobacteriota bacterium]
MRREEGFTVINEMAEECVDCGICVKECGFLQAYGSPQEQAIRWQAGGEEREKEEKIPFECSLCGLCHGVCPKNLDPSAMFLAMRREIVTRGRGNFRQHRTIRSYERRGSSSFFSWFHLPEECHTILFPGCALPGSRPRTLHRLFLHLQQLIPDIGLVLDCCCKPSHDLGDQRHFRKMFTELSTILDHHSIRKVLLACPNCYRIFKEYGGGLEVKSVYEELSGSAEFSGQLQAQVTVHDPCGVRFAEEVQESARQLLQQQGMDIQEMEHSRKKGYCCGEGGSAGFLRPDFARDWTQKRMAEAGERQVVSYCAGCTHFLGKVRRSSHLLDLLFDDPQSALAGRTKVSGAPFTYWNRYRLKRLVQREMSGGVGGTREELKRISAP